MIQPEFSPEEILEKLRNLKRGDYIAFPWTYNGGAKPEIATSIEVAEIITITSNKDKTKFSFGVGFLYGYKSLNEDVHSDHIIAIGNKNSGKTTIRGWRGNFDLINPTQFYLDQQKDS